MHLFYFYEYHHLLLSSDLKKPPAVNHIVTWSAAVVLKNSPSRSYIQVQNHKITCLHHYHHYQHHCHHYYKGEKASNTVTDH